MLPPLPARASASPATSAKDSNAVAASVANFNDPTRI
jgi:hypothetical protein